MEILQWYVEFLWMELCDTFSAILLWSERPMVDAKAVEVWTWWRTSWAQCATRLKGSLMFTWLGEISKDMVCAYISIIYIYMYIHDINVCMCIMKVFQMFQVWRHTFSVKTRHLSDAKTSRSQLLSDDCEVLSCIDNWHGDIDYQWYIVE